MEVLGFELFEIIILTLILIGLVFAGYKITLHCKYLFLKMREKKELDNHKKCEKMPLQYEKRGRRRSARLAKMLGPMT